MGLTEQTIASHPDAVQITSSSRNRITPQGNRVVQWFDPSVLRGQAPGFLGNVKRDSLPGPGTFNADISITKNTKITERLNVQFRAECFNCFNHFNVGGTGAGILGAIDTRRSVLLPGRPPPRSRRLLRLGRFSLH